MPIDVIISPETLIAREIYQRLLVPGTTTVVPMAEGKVHLLGIICLEDCPVLNTQLGQLPNLFPDLSFGIVSIMRNRKHVVPDADDMLEIGDEVYIVVDSNHMRRVMAAFGHLENTARRIIVSGGGNVGLSLVQLLRQQMHALQVKVIEEDDERAIALSEELEKVTVLNGSSLDRDVLKEASVDTAETFVALMRDDENNILASLLAKQYGCERVITLVNNNAYYPLVGPLGIDVMVSPNSIIVANIMQHVRRGRIKGIHNLGDGYAEVIEAEVSDSSRIVNKRIGALELPRAVVFSAIVRDGDVLIPSPELEIRANDHVIVLTAGSEAHYVEKLFSVHVDLFQR